MSDSEETLQDGTKPSSALEENISRKGSNSYYYAHGKKIDGPQWDGKEEPRLLGTSPLPKDSGKVIVSALDSYSWVDETKYIKIYIEFNNASEIEDSSISLESDETSFTFKFTSEEKPYALSIGPLFAEIEGCSYLKKADKFLLKLKKKAETSWYQLKKAST